MDILNFISWIRGNRVVTSVDPAKTLIPVGLKDGRRDDEYLAGAITVEDLAAQIAPEPAYKVYTALLTQSGTDAPVATVLENTIGDIVWTRTSDGEYNGILNNAFVVGKSYYNLTMTSGGGLDVGQFVHNPTQSDFISIATWSNDILTDELLSETPIEIRVYN
jgi:hypothetical protein